MLKKLTHRAKMNALADYIANTEHVFRMQSPHYCIHGCAQRLNIISDVHYFGDAEKEVYQQFAELLRVPYSYARELYHDYAITREDAVELIRKQAGARKRSAGAGSRPHQHQVRIRPASAAACASELIE